MLYYIAYKLVNWPTTNNIKDNVLFIVFGQVITNQFHNDKNYPVYAVYSYIELCHFGDWMCTELEQLVLILDPVASTRGD